MLTNYPVNPRVRAYGKARIDLAGRLKNPGDWEKLWKPPSNPFPFTWGESWKQCVEYRVDEFAAEVGFFVDVLGFPINALDSGYAMFTSPQNDFFFAIVPTTGNEQATPADAFRLQFMVKDLISTYQELLRRGIAFELAPQPLLPGSSLAIASFRTPNGISVELWGVMLEKPAPKSEMKVGKNHDDPDKAGQELGLDEIDQGDEYVEDDAENDDDEDLDEDEELDEDEHENGDNDEVDQDDEDDQELEEEAEEDDEDEDEFEYEEEEYDDDDEDEDDFDQDEYSSSTRTTPPKTSMMGQSAQSPDINATFAEKSVKEQQACLLEYIDVEIA
jgi:catechol 2,3-dioxygenase-like lactoylglutathione lyase family enzyme